MDVIMEDSIGDLTEAESSMLSNDEGGLSPASRRILEKCAVSVTPASSGKSVRLPATLLSRPSSSCLDATGFHFTKPARPASNFSGRPQPRGTPQAVGSELKQRGNNGNFQPQNGNGNSDLRTTPASSDKTVAHKSYTPRRPENGTTVTSSDNSQRIVNGGPAGTFTSTGTPRRPSPPRTIPTSHTEPEQPSMMEASVDNSSTLDETDNTTQPHQDVPKDGPINVPNSANAEAPPLPVRGRRFNSAESNVRQATVSPAITHNNSPVHGPLSRVTKRQGAAPKPRKTNPARSSGLSLPLTPGAQPSEEDLFFLLINKLKKRDEADAAATALRERLETEISDVTRENEILQKRANNVEVRCKKQEAELDSQRSLVERWKTRFGKLKSLIGGMSNDFESLRNDGKTLKSSQLSLVEEKDQIRLSLGQATENTERIQNQWDQHRVRLAAVQYEVSSLEQSLAVTRSKLLEKDEVIVDQRNRVATLESYIRSYSSRQQKQSAMIQQKQAEMLSKIQGIYQYLDESQNGLRSTLNVDAGSQLAPCLEILRALSQTEWLKPADLAGLSEMVHTTSRELNMQLQESAKTMESAFGRQDDESKRVAAELHHLQDTLTSTTALAEQLAEAQTMNRSLQEKLKSNEAVVVETKAAIEDLKSREVNLQGHIAELEAEISSLRQEKADLAMFQETEDHSELHAQLETTTAALTEATEAIKSKESEIADIEQRLIQTAAQLEAAESKVAGLESESGDFKQKALDMEQKIREELTRASLTAKEQSRASFEQERHKLRSEQVAAEKIIQQLKKQLASVESSLERARRSYNNATAKGDQQKQEIDDLKTSLRERSSEHALELARVKEEQEVCARKAKEAGESLEAARSENDKLKEEISNLQAAASASGGQEALWQSVNELQREIIEKDASISSLKETLSKLEDKAKAVPALEKAIAERSFGMEDLQRKLDEAAASNTQMANSIQAKDQELTSMAQKLSGSEKSASQVAELEKRVSERDDLIRTLEGQAQRANQWTGKIQNIFQSLQVLGPNEPLPQDLDALADRVGAVIGKLQKSGQATTPQKNGKVTGDLSVRRKSKLTRRKTILATPNAEQARSRACSRELETTEFIYRTRNVRESLSHSPSKAAASRRRDLERKKHRNPSVQSIIPFSQVEDDIGDKEDASPTLQLGDLNISFPSTPVPAQRNHESAGQAVQARDGVSIPQPMQEEQLSASQDMLLDDISDTCSLVPMVKQDDKQSGPAKSEREFKAEPQKHGAVVKDLSGPLGQNLTNGNRGKARENGALAPAKKDTNGKKDDEAFARPARHESQKAVTTQPPKSILKDISILQSAREPSLLQTPRNQTSMRETVGIMKSSVAFRRQGRTKSKYFNPTLSPVGSVAGSVRDSRASSKPDNIVAAKMRPRRRRRGDMYNDRFNQEFVGH